jgi:hypothetical protein
MPVFFPLKKLAKTGQRLHSDLEPNFACTCDTWKMIIGHCMASE